MREYVVELINQMRDDQDRRALERDECLDELGRDSVHEIDSEGTTYTKFNRECADEIPDCECNWQGESQLWTTLSDRTWREAIEHPFERAANDPSSGLFRNVVSDDWERVGVGVDPEGDLLLIAIEFAP
jgi:hypothetical protein